MDRRADLLWLAIGMLIGSVGLVGAGSVLTGIAGTGSTQAAQTQRPSLLRVFAGQRTFAAQQEGGGGSSRKPNILFIMGDDIGWMQPSIYHRGLMVGETPNIDRIAREGALFTDWYGQQSCTAGRAAFITGQSPIRTGLTKVGLPGAPEGLQQKDPTLAELLKPLGYATGQFGNNHLGDRNDFLPTVHGFEVF